MAPLWRALEQYRDRVAARPIAALFDADPARAEAFSVSAAGLMLDYSKTGVCAQGMAHLLALADGAGVEARRDAMFRGAAINETEGRAVLHTALRDPDGPPLVVDGVDVRPGIAGTLARMEAMAADVRAGRVRGAGGAITDVVNIGIGGSDLGPAMAVQALAPYHDGPRCHFVSNVDGAHVHDVLAGLDPARTLVIVASKTFTTLETMTNAATARDWMARAVADPGAQFVALSSAGDRAAAFGIPPDRVFGFEDWVGGRYSVWGPIGLSLMLAIGPERFRDFLAGAAAMDAHFRSAPLASSMPVLLALVGVWHAQVCGHATRAVIPYDQRLARLPAYLQQLEMESNGKRVGMDGRDLDRPSGPIVWGEPGTNGQHAFMQLIHQGTRVVPVEFLLAARGHEADLAHHHRLLVANCLAQAEALMRGRTLEAARAGLSAAALGGAELERQARHRVFPGNRPSTVLLYSRLTPRMLGAVLALYEHRVFVEGVILGINPFDQWGVELGKELAVSLTPLLEGTAEGGAHDASTLRLVAMVRADGVAPG
ncbi:glucose-6-phosphate isomerase [Rhodobaculum claviforme]|uniref:Glucose-6-phosphate isomerase n=1 Tax=Rhodobaculum claviforme TaxID=1549854 RepID=A0A934WIF8_9RHOB|nr:glucose-6-phosphate isomerase [Rhodobaculum claviforme]MBK5928170.1 glucose-6-phosphate isomerase [Rhodobaculum claviforme]